MGGVGETGVGVGVEEGVVGVGVEEGVVGVGVEEGGVGVGMEGDWGRERRRGIPAVFGRECMLRPCIGGMKKQGWEWRWGLGEGGWWGRRGGGGGWAFQLFCKTVLTEAMCPPSHVFYHTDAQDLDIPALYE